MYDIRTWSHVFKLDPNKSISDEHLEKICESGTDAVIVGGTDGVTLENVLELLARIRKFAVPCVLEISNMEAITPGFDYYFIPSVLNSREPTWLIDLHHQAVKEFRHMINWNEVFVEGYCMLNCESKAAKLTNAKTDLTPEDVAAYAVIAEKMFHLPIFYLEYSGTYGDPKLVREAKKQLNNTLLFYGGGIKNVSQAKEMAEAADVIVVGNAVYEDIDAALETVQIKHMRKA